MRKTLLLLVVVACGGRVATDAGPSPEDAMVLDAAADTGSSVTCKPFVTQTCDGGCPSGSYCIHQTNVAFEGETGCAPIPSSCNGMPSCACLNGCACMYPRYQCIDGPGFIHCGGPTSRRSAKKDIRAADAKEIARRTLAIRPSTYRYRDEPSDSRLHLGFIIDDQPTDSPAIAPDGEHVDLYGYTTMLLATVQEQERRIEALERKLAAP